MRQAACCESDNEFVRRPVWVRRSPRSASRQLASVNWKRCIDTATIGCVPLDIEPQPRWALPRLFVFVIAIAISLRDKLDNFIARQVVWEKRGELAFPLIAIAHFYIGCINTRSVRFVFNGHNACVGCVDPAWSGVITRRFALAVDLTFKDVPEVYFWASR